MSNELSKRVATEVLEWHKDTMVTGGIGEERYMITTWKTSEDGGFVPRPYLNNVLSTPDFENIDRAIEVANLYAQWHIDKRDQLTPTYRVSVYNIDGRG